MSALVREPPPRLVCRVTMKPAHPSEAQDGRIYCSSCGQVLLDSASRVSLPV